MSARAALLLEKMEYPDVRVLAGGWAEWLRMNMTDPHGYPVYGK